MTDNAMTNRKGTNNNQQHTTQKTKDWATLLHNNSRWPLRYESFKIYRENSTRNL